MLAVATMLLADVIDELQCYEGGWVKNSVGRYAGLIDDGKYLAEIQWYLLEHELEDVFGNEPVVDLSVNEATHSSQDGFNRDVLLGMLTASDVVGFDENRVSGVVLAIRDGSRLMIYDGNHRYTNVRLRGHSTVRARMHNRKKTSPTMIAEDYKASMKALQNALEREGLRCEEFAFNAVDVWLWRSDNQPVETVWVDGPYRYTWGPDYEFRGDVYDVIRYFKFLKG